MCIFFQVVTSGLLADLAPICCTEPIANDCAAIPGSCSGSDTWRSDGLIHLSAERAFCALVLLFNHLHIWQEEKNFITGL